MFPMHGGYERRDFTCPRNSSMASTVGAHSAGHKRVAELLRDLRENRPTLCVYCKQRLFPDQVHKSPYTVQFVITEEIL